MRCCSLLLCLLIGHLACPLPARAGTAATDGARSLTVRVLTTRTIRSLRAERLDRLHPEPPLTLTWQPGGIQVLPGALLKQLSLNGNYRLTPDDGNPVSAAGTWKFLWHRDGLRVLLTLPSERYVAAALTGEAAPDEPLASLKAMAIVIRTFALANAGRHAGEGFGLCDSTHCQALHLGAYSPAVESAVRETAGETLWFHGSLASVYYSQHCGGESESAQAVWPTEHAVYLIGMRADPYCLRRSPATWHADIPLDKLNEILRAQGWNMPSPLETVRITRRSQAGRAERLQLTGRGAPATLSASSLRFAVNRALGWYRIRSDWYSLRVAGGMLAIDGKGFGHGVGFCQTGALEMALEGHDTADILRFYFPHLETAVTSFGGRWQSAAGTGWTLLTTQSPASGTTLLPSGNAAWSKAVALLRWGPPSVHPVVQELPNTELFRQTTGQPGWMLASAKGNLIFLQPASVRGEPAETQALLVHEFLHVLVEGQAGEHAPLWLREGLVAMLAGKEKPSPGDMTPDEVNRLLAHAATLAESQLAHRAAASFAAELVARYGMPTVRRWMQYGVPPQITQGLRPAG